MSHHENRRFHCDYPNCKKSYPEKRFLENHFLSYHDKRKTEKDKIDDKIEVLEKHLTDIDSQIHTVAALISGFELFELKCGDCFSNK